MDIYAIGREVGSIGHRLCKVEKRLDRWKTNGRRLVLVLCLWTAVLVGMSSTDEAASLIAAIIKKLLI